MRKVLLICLTVSLLVSGTAFAAEQVVSVNPLGLVFGAFNVEYEWAIDDDSTWALRGLYWDDRTGAWSWSAFGAGGSYRKYFSPTAPAGGYWGVGGDNFIISADRTIGGVTRRGSGFVSRPKVEIGYKWLFEEGFTLGVGADLGFYVGGFEIAGEGIPLAGIALGLTLNLGYAW